MQLIQRYGDELEYDLHARTGLDLRDWIRGRHPWSKLLVLAGQLPRTSHYKAALADDDELIAEWIAQHGYPDEAAPAPPAMTDWSPERDQLVQLTEAVMALQRTLIAVNNKGKAPDLRPLPRPHTAWDRVERRRNLDGAAAVIALFSPTSEAPPDPGARADDPAQVLDLADYRTNVLEA